MPYQFTNNATTTLAAGITSGATSITVATGTGALFPTPSGASVFELTLVSASSSTFEIVKCTARTTDTLTITRAQEGTTAAAFLPGDRVELRVTAAVLNNFAQADGTLAVTGGGTGVQTLTGIAKGNGTSAFTAATAGTDYLAPPSGTAILKANSGGALANATAGTDYLAPPAGTAILKANSGGALANATAGTDYSAGTAALTTGIVKSTTTTGALSIAVAGTDYQAPIGTISGIAKGNGANALTAATAGTDYLAPPAGTAILKANSGGALANATAGTDYLAPPSGTAILKANSGGALANATAGTDYSAGTAALTTGILKSTTTTGALSIAASGTDYQAPIGTISGIAKGNGANALTAAVSGTDYQAPIGTISGIAKGNGANALTAATAGTDYSAGTSALATGILKSTTTTGALSIAAAGTDYQSPIGTISGIAKGNGANALTAAVSGTDYLAPPAGTSILKANSGGALANATGTDVTSLIGTNAVTNATNAVNTGITEDTATAVAVYPTWVTANTGNLPQKTTSTKLTFVPSTGVLTATSFTGAGTGLTGTASSLTAGTATAASGLNSTGLGTAQTWTASQRGTQTTNNTLSYDLSVTNNVKSTPTAGGTLTFTNIASATGQSGFILFVNGANYAISAAATTKVTSSLLGTISVTGTYLMSYYCDGTNVYVVASGALA